MRSERHVFRFACACAATLALAGCGGSSSTAGGSTSHVSTDAAPLLAIVSPMAKVVGGAPHALTSSVVSHIPVGHAESLPSMLEALKARLAASTLDACLANITLPPSGFQAQCYGPTLSFLHHPDGPSTPANTGPQCSVTGNGNGCLPGGDLGIWSASEMGAEACTSATMNSTVVPIAAQVNLSVTLMAGLICAAHVNGDDLTAGGAAIDMVSVLNDHMTGSTFTAATLQQLSDASDGNPRYKAVVTGTLNGTVLSVTAVHSPGDDTSHGIIYGYVDLDFGTPVREGFSVLYQTSSTTLRYEHRTGMTDPTATAADLFDADGTFSFANQLARSAPAGTGGGTYQRAEIDATTGLGALVQAWQAGNGDQFTRVFHASTTAGAGGADTGFGYFGFGPALDSPDLGEMVGMYCNWAGPGANAHQWTSGVANVNTTHVQGQTMLRNTTSGYFEPVTSHITYAPTNSCDSLASSSFVYESGMHDNSELGGLTAADVTNDLVPYGDASIGTMPTVTAPAAFSIAP